MVLVVLFGASTLGTEADTSTRPSAPVAVTECEAECAEARAAAERAVPGGRVTAVEEEDGGWEIEVERGDDDFDVVIDPAGAVVVEDD